MSLLTWHAQKVKAKHFGNINIKSGDLQINHGKLVGSNLIFDMNTITNSDIEDKKYRDMFLKDISSENFFDVSKFPEAKFKLLRAMPIGNNNFDVLGQLEIKGITGAVNFPLKLNYETNGKVIAEGTCSFNRTKFGIIYNSGSFFDGLGDKIINDTIKLDFNIVFQK